MNIFCIFYIFIFYNTNNSKHILSGIPTSPTKGGETSIPSHGTPIAPGQLLLSLCAYFITIF
jgi:hypothetical protein